MGDFLSRPDSTRDGWFPDPTRRHESRHFADEVWTDDVRDGAIDSTDPLGPLPPNRDAWLTPEVMVMITRSSHSDPPKEFAGRLSERQWVAVLIVSAVALAAVIVGAVLWPRQTGWVAMASLVVGSLVFRFSVMDRD